MGQLTYTTQEVQDRLDAVGTLVRPNLLDNAYFVGGGSQQGGGQFPINQRGQTSYPAGYTIDRWQSMAATTTVALTSESLRLTDSEPNWLLVQSMENVLVPGKTYTLSALYKAANSRIRLVVTWADGQFFYNLEAPVSSTYQLATITGTVPENATIDYKQVVVQALDANCIIDLQAMKLELGDTQTLAHQNENGDWILNEIPNFQQELAKCQRYFIGFNDSNNHWCASGTGLSSTNALVVFPTPVTMRAVPSVTFRDAYLQGNSSVWLAVTGMSAQSKNENSVALMCDTTGLTAGAAVTLAATKIFLSADL